MLVKYKGPQRVWSCYSFGNDQFEFEAGKPVEVPEAVGADLIKRSDFERVVDAAPKAAPKPAAAAPPKPKPEDEE